jgi:hypothetical protein
MAFSLILSNNAIIIPGLSYTLYRGYNNGNTIYASQNKSNLFNGNPISSPYGYVTSISDLITGTNQYITYTGWGGQTATYQNFTIKYPPDINSTNLSNYTVQWLGYFKPDVTGTWNFILGSDDDSFLWIGQNALSGFTSSNANIAFPNPQPLAFTSCTIYLTAGVYYPIRILYGQQGGLDQITFAFSNDNGTTWNTNGNGYFYFINNGSIQP